MATQYRPNRFQALQDLAVSSFQGGIERGQKSAENDRQAALLGTETVNKLSEKYNVTPDQQQKVVDAYRKGDANVLSQIFGEIQKTENYRPEIAATKAREVEKYNLEKQASELGLKKTQAEIDEFNKPYNETKEGRKFKYQEEIKAGIKGTAGGFGGKLTKGEEAADRTFAKEYVDYVQKGGREKVNQALKSLSEAKSLLSTSDNISGPIIGSVPQFVRSRFSPDSKKVQDIIQKAVQGDLKGSLGPQFTEREGQQLMERAYDPSLSEPENERRLEAVIQEIIARRDALDESTQYFQQKGTLKGIQQGNMQTQQPNQNAELQRLQFLRQKAGK